MTLTVFTAVVGSTPDVLRAPLAFNPGVRYVCLTDRPASDTPAPYIHVPVTVPPGGPRASAYLARALKIRADHPALDAPDFTLWHDASFQLRHDPLAIVRDHLGICDLLAFRHPHRCRIEDEGEVIADLGYTPRETVRDQVRTYRAAGFTQTVLTATGFLLRRMTPEVQAFNTDWADEVVRWGWRDQMSVDYCLWRHRLTAVYLGGHYSQNPFATFWPDPTRRRAVKPRVRLGAG